MGKIYKRKRRSCSLCKPHKTGIVDKMTARARQEATFAEKEIREVMGCMEHHCPKCREVTIDNDSQKHNCPKCGTPMYRLCDEVFENPDGDDRVYYFSDGEEDL
jgi:predicted RNA-binding Zn-ribbon protein involved in translation (DUF1610 family)